VVLQLFSLANFKSFAAADLPLAELTVLVGANASGKSNLIEGLQLLSWLARGRRLHELQASLREREVTVRGIESEFALTAGAPIRFFASIPGGDELGMLRLNLSLGTREGQPGLCVLAESLDAPDLSESKLPLYFATPASGLNGTLTVSYNNFSKGRNKPEIPAIDQQPVFTQLTTPARFDSKHARSQDLIPRAARVVQKTLESIRFLDPAPATMRSYSFKNETELAANGRNVSAVINALCKDAHGKGEVLSFIQALPEQNISDVTFVETARNEVMVQLVESFGARQVARDAALLSDGTLRVLAIAAALLSVEPGTLVVIEEIDNGVHPSRARHLIEQIQRVAAERSLRVLLTTHNPALMNALSPRALAAVVVCYRDESGNSSLVRLQDVARYPELLAKGRLGDVAASGALDHFIKNANVAYDPTPFFELLKASEGP
jgi:predicted ATPase